MVSLPLFQRVEAEAWTPNLEGIKTSPTEYAIVSAKDWKLKDGGDTVVIGFSQEPASMFDLVESAAVQRQAYYLGVSNVNTQYDYDYQPASQDPLSTVESGLSTNDGCRREGRRHGLHASKARRPSWPQASRSSTPRATRSNTTAPARCR